MTETRIQLCGPLVAQVGDARVEQQLPGRQGRALFALLVTRRHAPLARPQLVDALWDGDAPEAADTALSALLSKLRRVVPLEGRHALRLALPADAWVDVEAAAQALHRAQAAAAAEDWLGAWGPARVAQHVFERPFLEGDASAWAADRRRAHGESLVRALEVAATASLHIGGAELDTAERAARRLTELAPLRESATRILMEVHERRGNRGDALLAFEALRQRLRDELGASPSPETQALHRALLG